MSGATSSVTTAASTNMPSAAAASSSSAAALGAKKCFNPECPELKSRKGWRLRSGEYADLCDRCALAYEEGRFCETFHLNACGWRSCESCGKRVHCGCIVSNHSFILLDVGGIECMACARKNLPLVRTSNPAWPPPVFCHSPLTERLKDPSGKAWNQLAGSGPVPWRQAPSLFNSSITHSDVNLRMLYDLERLNTIERLSTRSLEKEKIEDTSERSMNGSLNLGARDILENGIAGTNSEEPSGFCLNTMQQSSSLRDDPSSPLFGVGVLSLNDTNKIGASGSPICSTSSPSVMKQFHGNLHNGVDSLVDSQIRTGRPRADARGRSQLLPRYRPRFTDEELQRISGNSNSVITPLFEKMLSASDAGRIGRLVLPKKCAEAYFPAISQPEGLPLQVQDSKGKEWIFQFRFWPNNNSRMYVLEGVTPCIQNMQLQAGDIVTFSRLEPQGKLVMGYRKASVAAPADQDSETNKMRNAASTNGDAELGEPSHWSKIDKSGYIAKDVESKSPIKKRKSSTLGSKSKRLRIDNDDMMELKLTWEEAQGRLRPPPDHVPSIVVIEGFEFEEYEDAPVLGKPTIFSTDSKGHKIQWVQCEDCCKWRKLPADALLPSRWTCSDNLWDPERSSCSAAQELTAEQLEDLLPSCTTTVAASKKLKPSKVEVDNLDSLEGLDTLANLAILGEGETLSASSHATTKHPRHRPGCSCIVCIQPPSGKGPKHKQTCTCNVCQTVKRRFKTLMMKRDKKKSEKEAETSQKKAQERSPEKLMDDEPSPSGNTGNSTPKKMMMVIECSDNDLSKSKVSTASPFKGQIDLNMQPEREEELSPVSESGGMMKMFQDATTERYPRQQKSPNQDANDNSTIHQTLLGGTGTDDTAGIRFTFSSSHSDAGDGRPTSFSLKSSASTPEAG